VPVRYAIVGLGHIAQTAVVPAFAHAKRNSRLVALVSDDEAKRRTLGRRLRVPTTDHEGYDGLLDSGDVDAVYIALPNAQHADFATRALRRGVHVLCEKPLATTSRDCKRMIRLAQRRRLRLMTAYRLHFERANLRALSLARSGRLGELRHLTASFCMQIEPGNVRLDREQGAGTLWDLGIYCLNAARTLFDAEPLEVTAFDARRRGDARFREVDEMTSAVLRFPGDRLACITSSFGAADAAWFEILGTRGSLRLDPAFHHSKPLELWLTLAGRTRRQRYPRRDQFAPELLYFSDCILRGKAPKPDGHEGLADVRVLEALERSAHSGRAVRLAPLPRRPGPSLKQERHRAAVRRRPVVGARAPRR
jgi:glucose-fructose oxidoreductase